MDDDTLAFGSQLTIDTLQKLALVYNMMCEETSIDMSLNKDELINVLKNKLNCKTGKCFTKKIVNMNDKLHDPILSDKLKDQLLNYTWAPKGPKNSNIWLNNIHISDMLTQFSHINDKFAFIDTVPINIHTIDSNIGKWFDEPDFDKYYNKGRTILGIVYNTDVYGGPGQHWFPIVIDLVKGDTYFMDSYGIDPPKEVLRLMKKVYKWAKAKGKEGNGYISKNRHQYGNSECGVYSISFILRMARDIDSFDEITSIDVPDNEIEKCRQVYFNSY